MKKYLLSLMLATLYGMTVWGAMPSGYTFYTTTNGVSTAFTALPTAYRCAIGIAWNSTQRTSSSNPTEIGAGIPTDFQGSFVIPSFLQDQAYSVTEIGYKAFYKCEGITSISIPNSITYIDVNAFNGCTGLTKVNIPGSVGIIDDYAFTCCHNLNTVTINDGTNTIGNYAFLACKSLSSIDIPASVTKIGSQAFGGAQIAHDGIGYGSYEGCDNLTKVIVHWDEPISISSGTFSNIANCTLYVPKGKVETYSNANVWKDFKAIKEYPPIIEFADASVKSICVSNWDTDGDGELSEDEAAAVTSIGVAFQNKKEITSFSEFKYFTGVTTIGQYALSGCTNLRTIVFPSSLKAIDRYALYNSAFESLVIPDNVTSIGNSAIRDCGSLTNVTIGKNTMVFGKNVFRDCTSLNSIVFDGTECHFNGEDAFRNCSALTSVVITDIGAWCKSSFYYSDCNPLSITNSLSLQDLDYNNSVVRHLAIPDDITAINAKTFYMCKSLESVIIPSSVTSIGNYAFYGCSNLSSVIVDFAEPIEITSTVFSNRANATLYVPTGCKEKYESANYWKEFGEIVEMSSQLKDGDVFTYKIIEGIDLTFKVISSLDKTCEVLSANFPTDYEGGVTIPSIVYGYKVVSLGYRSFRRTTLSSVVIPTSIEIIDTEAFEQCNKLTSVIIPDGIRTIRSEAFKTCSSLEQIEIAGSIKNIYSEVFKNCSKLKTVILKNGLAMLGNSMFENCTSLENIELPNSMISIGWGTFWGCSALSSISIPFGVYAIEASAFYGCTSLTSIVIPDGVKSIGGNAFQGCTNLLSIDIPNTIESIGRQAFDNTKWYNNQNDGVVYAGKVAYKYKGEMPERCSIIIDEGIVSISPDAFTNNKNLIEINLPQSISSIGESCFSNCSNLEKVRVAMVEPATISSSTFYNVNNAFLYVPEGCVEKYMNAEYWKDFLCIKQHSDPEMFSGGEGTETNPYLINTIGDMKVLSRDVNSGISYEDTFFKVAKKEIDFTGVNFTAIGSSTKRFAGTFDGDSVVIKNLSMNEALFGYIGAKGVVANIIIDESCKIIGNYMNVAGVAGSNKGTIDNCINKAPISSSKFHIGGICGDNMGTISNCKNYGTIASTSTNYDGMMIGGIAGDIDGGKIYYCENHGNVSGDFYAIGGIVGFVDGQNNSIDNCINTGDVTGVFDVGGIIGYGGNRVSISNNLVSGCTITATSTQSDHGGGAIGTIGNASNNFYTTDVVLKKAETVYDGLTPRGVWCQDTSTHSYGPADITENCAAMILQMGDANRDGRVNVTDIMAVANHILKQTGSNFNEKAADVNGDGRVNVTDIMGIANIILKVNTEQNAPARALTLDPQ